MSPSGRIRVMEGLQKYASLVHLKVNGKSIDIAQEFTKPQNKRTKILESDIVEISGPMMIDGVHMVNSDPDRRKNMNSRTRFYFEFLSSGVLLPTEVLEP